MTSCFPATRTAGTGRPKEGDVKGIIFNLLEQFCCARLGEPAYDRLVDGLDGLAHDPRLMIAPGTYADEDFLLLVQAVARELAVDDAELLREFGRFALARLAERYPDFFTPFRHPRDFFRFVGMVHHVEVSKLYQGATVPRFACQEAEDGALLLSYRSERRLCPFVEGLIAGVGRHYGTGIECRHERCMNAGATACEFRLRFPSDAPPAHEGGSAVP